MIPSKAKINWFISQNWDPKETDPSSVAGENVTQKEERLLSTMMSWATPRFIRAKKVVICFHDAFVEMDLVR